jgi:thymidylate synthase (FAD)
MKLIKPSYEIITPINGEEILKQIELAARTCYKSETKIEYGDIVTINGNNSYTIKNAAKTARVLISKLIDNCHEAMLEFAGSITVKFICDRGVSHELVRHRLCSFAQESTRYCNYGKDDHITFIIPCWLDIHENEYTRNHSDFLNMPDTTYDWCQTMLNLEYRYNSLITLGWQPQQARSVLPNSLKTEINVSANIREWRHIFKLRTTKMAHPQMRELMCPLLDEFKSKIPLLFDDITY